MFDELALTLGFSSFPSQTQVFEDEALTFGLISFPDNTQVLEEVAPVFGFNSAPLQTQLLGKLILFDMIFPHNWLITANVQYAPQTVHTSIIHLKLVT